MGRASEAAEASFGLCRCWGFLRISSPTPSPLAPLAPAGLQHRTSWCNSGGRACRRGGQAQKLVAATPFLVVSVEPPQRVVLWAGPVGRVSLSRKDFVSWAPCLVSPCEVQVAAFNAAGGVTWRRMVQFGAFTSAGLLPDAVTFGVAVDVCGKHGRWQEVAQLLEHMAAWTRKSCT